MAVIIKMPDKVLHFDGRCPFLLCLDRGEHDHPVCRACNTVNYGNFNCVPCRQKVDAYRDGLMKRWTETSKREGC